MKQLLFLLVLCGSFSVQSQNKALKKKISFVDKTVDFVIANKDNQIIELPRIYDSLSTGLPEKSIIIVAEKLEKRGFKNISSGRGNYPPRGPRIVSKTYQKGNCICEVSKIYYATTVENSYEMADRIRCTDSTTYFSKHKK